MLLPLARLLIVSESPSEVDAIERLLKGAVSLVEQIADPEYLRRELTSSEEPLVALVLDPEIVLSLESWLSERFLETPLVFYPKSHCHLAPWMQRYEVISTLEALPTALERACRGAQLYRGYRPGFEARWWSVMSAVAGELSHHFNNILQPILTHAELLRLDLNSEEGAELASAIEASTIRGMEFTRDVLSVVAIDKLHDRPVAFTALVHEAMDDWRMLGPKCRVEIERIETPIFVTAIPSLLRDALVRIAHRWSDVPGCLRWRFQDVETGTPYASLEGAFEGPRRPSSIPALARAIVHVHGGQVEPCAKDGGEGVVIRLPQERAIDTGSFDSGSFDSGSFDSGSFDSGSFDSGSLDTGSFDTSGP